MWLPLMDAPQSRERLVAATGTEAKVEVIRDEMRRDEMR